MENLLAWVADMEELVGNQKPPSAEAKVAKAQLEEQKVRSWHIPPTLRIRGPGVPAAERLCWGGEGGRGFPSQP